MRLVASFPRPRSGFDPRSGHVGFVVDEVELKTKTKVRGL
jgi:hypothetical protein